MSPTTKTLCGTYLLASAITAAPTASEWPAWLESWLFNPSERTERGLESAHSGTPADALPQLETALRLAADQPLEQFNAGTARLNASSSDPRPLLEAAAESTSEDLAAAAFYNLGNAHLAGKDPQGAIEAYKNTLRHDPGFEDAKYNLELARHLLEQQQNQSSEGEEQQEQAGEGASEPLEPEENEQQGEEGGEQQGREEGQGSEEQRSGEPQQTDEEQQTEEQQQTGEQQQSGEGQPQPQEPGQQTRQQESPLPQFRDLPDMSAEEAAAILEAIENMEREQRRQAALKAAKRQARGKKDW